MEAAIAESPLPPNFRRCETAQYSPEGVRERPRLLTDRRLRRKIRHLSNLTLRYRSVATMSRATCQEKPSNPKLAERKNKSDAQRRGSCR